MTRCLVNGATQATKKKKSKLSDVADFKQAHPVHGMNERNSIINDTTQ